jgi:glycosyltransferase involved in cell wall biosynthesis
MRGDNNKGWYWTNTDYSRSLLEEDESISPKISIVTPSLNQGQYLEATICSVLDQGYPNLEYIIIDGGSTDNSVEIIKKYQKYISFWCSESDNGHYAAINKGFTKATGEIFAWINSDDLYCPWALRTVAQAFTQIKHVKWLSTLSPFAWDANGYCINVGHLPGFSKKAFLDGCYLPLKNERIGWIQQESTFWRRELWEEVGGLRESMNLAADFDLWARFYKNTELYGIVTPLAGFRWYSNQRSLDISNYLTEAEVALFELRESSNYRIKRQPLLRSFLSKIPKIRTYTNLYYKQKLENYSGIQLVPAGRESPGKWKEAEIIFSPQFRPGKNENGE